MKKIVIAGALVALTSAMSFAQDAKPAAPLTPVPAAGALRGPAALPGQAMHAPNPTLTGEQRQQRMAEAQSKYMENQYKLTPEQYKGVYAACLDFAKGMDEMRAQGKMPKPEDREKLEAAKDAKFQTILSKEQFEKYTATKRRPPLAPGVRPNVPQAPTPAPQAAPGQK